MQPLHLWPPLPVIAEFAAPADAPEPVTQTEAHSVGQIDNLPNTLPASSPEEIKAYVLEAVSEKTGYPTEVLDLDLDLEADLGVDTVKQAEMFAAIRGRYGIARREDLRLSDYNTLAKVIQFVEDSLSAAPAPVTAPQPVIADVASPIATTSPPPLSRRERSPVPSHCGEVRRVMERTPREIKTYVLAAVSEKTGYPSEVLDLDLDLEADLGIDTVKQAELLRGNPQPVRDCPARRFAPFGLQHARQGHPVRQGCTQFNRCAGGGAPACNDRSCPAGSCSATPMIEVAAPVSTTLTPLPADVGLSPLPAGRAVGEERAPEEIKAYVLAVVSEKTGYPPEMLDLDLDLEADLGIDTVKQAELFAAIRGQYNIARREDLRLSDYNTLAKVIHS